MNTISLEEFAALSDDNYLNGIFDDIVNAGKDLVTGEIGNVITGKSSPNDILDNLVEAGQNKIIDAGNKEIGRAIGGKSTPPPRPPQGNYLPTPPPRPPQGNYLPPPPPNMPAVVNNSPVEPAGRTLALPPNDNPVGIINNPLRSEEHTSELQSH